MGKFLTIAEAARELGLSENYLRQRCRAGTLPFIKAGRKFLVNVTATAEQLEAESKEGATDR